MCRSGSPFPGVAEAAEFCAIDLDARPRISVTLPIDKSPQQRQAQVQKLREQLPLHSVDSLAGICRLLNVVADFFEPRLRVEKSSFL
ncbi:MAG: hypothetical protein ACKOSQ_04480 [Planctomycetaceae bacterium]